MRTIFSTAFLSLLIPSLVGAATLRLERPSVPVHAGDTIAVDLFLDTGSDVLNTLEGSIDVSPELTLQDVRFPGSFVPLWITSPAEVSPGMIHFAGVIPGGYQGSGAGMARGNICTFIFETRTQGTARLSFGSDTHVYKNDGNGTPAQLSDPSLSFTILPAGAAAHTVDLPPDTTPPEAFAPLVVPGAPYGRAGSVLIFATQDKDSGVDHFDVAHSYNKYAQEKDLVWQTVESPYSMSESDADQYTFIRAVDHAGNTRVATVPPQRMSITEFVYQWRWAIFALLLTISGILFYARVWMKEGRVRRYNR